MKSKLLIASLGLVAASAYAQPSMPAGVSPSVNRPEVSPTSIPQPAMQRPAPQPAVGATGGNGGNGGNSGLMIGNGGNGARPAPPSTISSGPLPANDVKGPTTVGATGVSTPLPRGVGPSPLKNDDVGGEIYRPPHLPPLPPPPSTPGMNRGDAKGDAQWWKEQAQSEAQVLEQKHQSDPFCMYDAYGIKQCL